MATFSKTILSGSTDGRGILVAATATPGTTLHTGPTNTAHLHEVWLYAMNTSTTAVNLDIQWGGTTAPNDDVELAIQPESGLVLVIPGLIIKGNASPLIIRAFAGTTNVLTIHGFVNVIS